MAQNQQNNNGKFSGRVYSDYYWLAEHFDEDLEGEHGMWVRRVYFTYDRQINDAFSARFRLEGNTPGDFSTSAKITPVVKDLYLRWENEQHQIEAGISSTPTFGLVEDVWGYRSVEKSPLDMQDFASSRDMGLSFEGELDEAGRINYHLMVGNGNSNSSEFNRGKKVMLALSYELTQKLVVEAYADYEDRTAENARATLQGFVGYRSETLNAGALFAHQSRYNEGPFGGDVGLGIASVFANFDIAPRAKGIVRLDKTFDPVPGLTDNDYFPISNRAASAILIAGIDLELSKDIHLIPNLESAFYEEDDNGQSPGSTLLPRLTLFYNF